MAIITTNQPTAGLAGFSQNRRALTVDNRSSEYQYADGANQLQNSQSLFPDANIPLSKIDARFPGEYDAIATKSHVLNTTLIEYDAIVFYRIADVVQYAIDKGLSSFSIFLSNGRYEELSNIGGGASSSVGLALTIVGASRDGVIIDFGTNTSSILLGPNSLLQNLTVTSNRTSLEWLILPQGDDGCTNSKILNCTIEITSTVASADKRMIVLSGANVVMQGCTITHLGAANSSFMILLELIASANGSLNMLISDNNFTAANNSNSTCVGIYCGSTNLTIVGLNISSNIMLLHGSSAAGVLLTPLTATPLAEQKGINIFSNNDITTRGSIAGQGIALTYALGQTAVSFNTVNIFSGNRFLGLNFAMTTGVNCASGTNILEGNFFDNVVTGVVISSGPAFTSRTNITNNFINSTLTGISLVQSGRYIVSQNNIYHSIAGYAVDSTGTKTGCIFSNNITENLGAGSGVAYRGGTFTDCVFEGNRARTGTVAGLLIQATVAAGTNIITSNRNIGGGAGFLSFAVGTNIVANNLST